MNWDEDIIIIVDYKKITKFLKNWQQNDWETISNENTKEIPKEIPK